MGKRNRKKSQKPVGVGAPRKEPNEAIRVPDGIAEHLYRVLLLTGVHEGEQGTELQFWCGQLAAKLNSGLSVADTMNHMRCQAILLVVANALIGALHEQGSSFQADVRLSLRDGMGAVAVFDPDSGEGKSFNVELSEVLKELWSGKGWRAVASGLLQKMVAEFMVKAQEEGTLERHPSEGPEPTPEPDTEPQEVRLEADIKEVNPAPSGPECFGGEDYPSEAPVEDPLEDEAEPPDLYSSADGPGVDAEPMGGEDPLF